MRQFEGQVNDFMDSLIEESAILEAAPVAAAFSPPLSDKEMTKLGYESPRVHITYLLFFFHSSLSRLKCSGPEDPSNLNKMLTQCSYLTVI